MKLKYIECVKGQKEGENDTDNLIGFHPDLSRIDNEEYEGSDDDTYHTVLFEQWLEFSASDYEFNVLYPTILAAKNNNANVRVFLGDTLVDTINIAGEEGLQARSSSKIDIKNPGFHKVTLKYIVKTENNQIDNDVKLTFKKYP